MNFPTLPLAPQASGGVKQLPSGHAQVHSPKGCGQKDSK